MTEFFADEHYEEAFEFPLWKLVKQRAKERDISYAQASQEVLPNYVKTIRYRDYEYEDSEIGKWSEELNRLAVHERESDL